jgi:hypothetical protein
MEAERKWKNISQVLKKTNEDQNFTSNEHVPQECKGKFIKLRSIYC